MTTRPRIVRKNVRLDQEKLTRAKEILGARTETEAIVFRREIREGIERLRKLDVFRGVNGDDVFAAPDEP